MSGPQKKKLCWNCEGRVSLSEENCPYCAVYLGPAVSDHGKRDILAPPYRLVEAEEEETLPQSPYTVQQENREEEREPDLEVVKEAATEDLKQVIVPLGLLSAGTLFFLFGLMLLVFSHEGAFTLTWNAAYWYVYLLFALPLLVIGWRALQHFDEGKEQG